MLVKKRFLLLFVCLSVLRNFCVGSSVESFSALKLPRGFKMEHYFREGVSVDRLPFFSKPELKDILIVKREEWKLYSALFSLEGRFPFDDKKRSINFFTSFSKEIFGKYILDGAVDLLLKEEKNRKPICLPNVYFMIGDRDYYILSSFNKKERNFSSSSINTHFQLPFLLQSSFSPGLKFFYFGNTKNLVSFPRFDFKFKKIKYKKLFVSSQEEYCRFLVRLESTRSTAVDNPWSSFVPFLFSSDKFFLSLKPEYVVEMSSGIKVVGKLNFIFIRDVKSKDKKEEAGVNNNKKPEFPLAVYPGLDFECKKNDNLVVFLKTNNGCSFYDFCFLCEKNSEMNKNVSGKLSFDRLNMEIGCSNVYSSSFKWSLSCPLHWKQLFSFALKEGEEGIELPLDPKFSFLLSPFLSGDLSLCRRKIILSFRNKSNFVFGSVKSDHIPINHVSFKMCCRFKKRHVILFSVQHKFLKMGGYKNLFFLSFEYNCYFSENLLFFIKIPNIERFFFDKILCKYKILSEDSFKQEKDEFYNSREKFYVAAGFRIPM